MSKKYGLIIPDKSKPLPKFQASRNVFGEDSDSDEETKKKPVLLQPSHNINRQAKLTQEKAITEDPTVYQYDEIYDSMASKKEVNKIKSKEEKKPRYIENLMKSANKRKIENERRIERQIQKEREMEGDEFADKEVFVTSAYKKKLEEMTLEEEKEKREQYLESIGDVTKQSDLGGFYRHLYEQKLGSDKNIEEKELPSTAENNKNEKEHDKTNIPDGLETSKKRNYRKRKSSEHKKYLSEGEIEDSDDDEINRLNLKDIRLAKSSKNNQENIDADSDFSIDESSDEENADKDKNDVKPELSSEVTLKTSGIQDSTQITENDDTNNEKDDKPKEVEKVFTPVETKPKIDIWKKRTIGEVFDQALKRYYERKAARGTK